MGNEQCGEIESVATACADGVQKIWGGEAAVFNLEKPTESRAGGSHEASV